MSRMDSQIENETKNYVCDVAFVSQYNWLYFLVCEELYLFS